MRGLKRVGEYIGRKHKRIKINKYNSDMWHVSKKEFKRKRSGFKLEAIG